MRLKEPSDHRHKEPENLALSKAMGRVFRKKKKIPVTVGARSAVSCLLCLRSRSTFQ